MCPSVSEWRSQWRSWFNEYVSTLYFMFQVMATWKKLLYNVNVNVILFLDLHYPKPGEQYVPSTCYTDSRWTMYSYQSDLVRPYTPAPFHPSLAALTTLSLGVSFPSTRQNSFAKSGGGAVMHIVRIFTKVWLTHSVIWLLHNMSSF